MTKETKTIKKIIADMPSGRSKQIMEMRCSGESLRDIGSAMNLSYEQVRQYLLMIYEQLPVLFEDRYLWLYCNYKISEQAAVDIWGLVRESHYYLYYRYASRCKKQNLKLLLSDPAVPKYIREPYERYLMYKRSDLRNRRVNFDQMVMARYFSVTPCTIPLFVEKSVELANEFNIDESARVSLEGTVVVQRLSKNKFVLSCGNHTYRYYYWKLQTIMKMFQSIDLKKYVGNSVSASVIFLDNKEMMNKAGLYSGNELHSLIKKATDICSIYNITVLRMPYLYFAGK